MGWNTMLGILVLQRLMRLLVIVEGGRRHLLLSLRLRLLRLVGVTRHGG